MEPPYLCDTRASWSLFLGSSSCSKDLWNSLLAASETPKELNLRSILASKIVGYSYSTQLPPPTGNSSKIVCYSYSTQLPPPTGNSSTFVISVAYCMLGWELILHFGPASHLPSIEVLLNCYYKMWVQFTGPCSVHSEFIASLLDPIQWDEWIHSKASEIIWHIWMHFVVTFIFFKTQNNHCVIYPKP